MRERRTATMPASRAGEDRTDATPALILTVGHSARPLEEFF
jgi:hypothetical protein